MLFSATEESVIEEAKVEVGLIKKCICCQWVYVHIAALFDAQIPDPRTSSDVCGIDNVLLYFLPLSFLFSKYLRSWKSSINGVVRVRLSRSGVCGI